MNLEEKYREYSNKQLLEVIVKAKDYQPEAVEIARLLLSERNISNEEREKIHHDLETEQKIQEEKELKIRKTEEKLINQLILTLKKFNPLNKEEPSESRIVKLITLVFGLIYLSQLYNDFPILISLFTDPPKRFEWEIIFFLIGIVYLPISLYYFYKLKKSGWVLVSLYMMFSFLLVLNLYMWTWGRSSTDLFYNYSPKMHDSTFIFTSFFYLGTLYLLLKKQIIELFSVDLKTKNYTLAFGVIGLLVVLYFSLFD